MKVSQTFHWPAETQTFGLMVHPCVRSLENALHLWLRQKNLYSSIINDWHTLAVHQPQMFHRKKNLYQSVCISPITLKVIPSNQYPSGSNLQTSPVKWTQHAAHRAPQAAQTTPRYFEILVENVQELWGTSRGPSGLRPQENQQRSLQISATGWWRGYDRCLLLVELLLSLNSLNSLFSSLQSPATNTSRRASKFTQHSERQRTFGVKGWVSTCFLLSPTSVKETKVFLWNIWNLLKEVVVFVCFATSLTQE